MHGVIRGNLGVPVELADQIDEGLQQIVNQSPRPKGRVIDP